ncbi:MAG: oligosaccharide flippase family protein [Candidatus Kapabacteria bacterium]|nr:oligosaccharide flippase family protein [Candidatus Kapabacteria bacterium]
MKDKLRSLASDTLVYGTSTIAQRFLTFMLTPLYTNYLTLSEAGDMQFLYSLIAFANILYSFGFEAAFLRYYRDGGDQKSVYTHSYLAIAGITGAVTFMLYLFSAPIADILSLESTNALWLTQLAIAIPFLDCFMLIPFARLRMERKPRVFAILKLFNVVVAVVLNIILVVWMKKGCEGVLVSSVIASFIGMAVFVPSVLRHLKFEWNADLFSDLTAFGLPTLPSGFSAMILQVADRPILKAFASTDAVALYSMNYRLGLPMLLMVSVFEQAWKPFYLSHANDDDPKPLFARVMTYFTVVSAVIFLVVSLFVQYIVQLPFPGGKFFNPVYWSGLGIVPVVTAAYYFNGLATNFATGLYITKRTRTLPLATGAAALTNVLMNIILIPAIGYMGAAYATLGAYMVSAVVMYLYSQREYPIAYEWQRVVMICGICCVEYALILLFGKALGGNAELILHIAAVPLFFALLLATNVFTVGERKAALSSMRKVLRR